MTTDTEDRGDSIARWLDSLADAHDRRGEANFADRHYHRGIAILYRARAQDVRSQMDIPIPPRHLNTGEIILS